MRLPTVEERALAAHSALVDVVRTKIEGTDPVSEMVRLHQAFDTQARCRQTLALQHGENVAGRGD